MTLSLSAQNPARQSHCNGLFASRRIIYTSPARIPRNGRSQTDHHNNSVQDSNMVSCSPQYPLLRVAVPRSRAIHASSTSSGYPILSRVSTAGQTQLYSALPVAGVRSTGISGPDFSSTFARLALRSSALASSASGGAKSKSACVYSASGSFICAS